VPLPAPKKTIAANRARIVGREKLTTASDRNFAATVADLPQRDGINQVDMTRHQSGKDVVGIIPGILAQ
jgi:hypothetical protein